MINQNQNQRNKEYYNKLQFLNNTTRFIKVQIDKKTDFLQKQKQANYIRNEEFEFSLH